MKETMRQTLRNHEEATKQTPRTTPSPSHYATRSSSRPTTPPIVHRKPVGSNSSAESVAWMATEDAYLAAYAARHAGTHQKPQPRGETKKVRRKGIVTMYREAGPSDGELLGGMVKKAWGEWKERKEEESRHVRPSTSASSNHHHRRGGSGVATPVRGGQTLYGHTKHTAYVQDSTKPDDLDVLVSVVSDKVAQLGKGFSDRAVDAKQRKREERQRKEREVLKKTISSPKPVEDDADWARASSGRPSVESSAPPSFTASSPRPSFDSARSVRPVFDASKTSGSMADRMAKRTSGFAIPFWPKGKKDKKTSGSVPSSAWASPQKPAYTPPGHVYDEEYRRVTQIGDFMNPDVAAAPWNQHVNKANPFSPAKSSHSKNSLAEKKNKGSGSSSPGFFGKFVPSPSSLFGAGSATHSSPSLQQHEPRRRASDESFFGCVGISVAEEREAQHVVHQEAARDQQLIEGLNYRPPPTPPRLGEYSGSSGGGRRPMFVADSSDDDDDAKSHDDYRVDAGYYHYRQPSARHVPPQLSSVQHSPSLVSDPFAVNRHSMTAELVVSQSPPYHMRRDDSDDDDNARSTTSVDLDRVSWWDPPSPLPPAPLAFSKARGKEQEGRYVQPRQEWKRKVGKTEDEAQRVQYWNSYRRGLRDTKYSDGGEGKPF